MGEKPARDEVVLSGKTVSDVEQLTFDALEDCKDEALDKNTGGVEAIGDCSTNGLEEEDGCKSKGVVETDNTGDDMDD